LNCEKLKELETTVYWPQGSDRSDGTPVVSCLAQRFISFDSKPFKKHFLLNNTSKLPNLHLLRILPSNDPVNRYAWCGNPSIAHRSRVYKAIFGAIDGFSAQTGDAARLPASELQVGGQIFDLRGGRYRKTITLDSLPWKY
jgi:hypothetical protein